MARILHDKEILKTSDVRILTEVGIVAFIQIQISMGKVGIQLSLSQLWLNRRANWAIDNQCRGKNILSLNQP